MECRTCDIDLSGYTGPLSIEEIQGLLRALNDEYHAWSTYDQVVRDFGSVNPFVNIRESEARHIELLRSLFRRYGVPIPPNPWLGSVPRFTSVVEACRAGVEGEIANRALYDELGESTSRDAILTAYGRLRAASEQRHLRAFTRCAAREGHGGRGAGRRR
jgi:hypothetical protein